MGNWILSIYCTEKWVLQLKTRLLGVTHTVPMEEHMACNLYSNHRHVQCNNRASKYSSSKWTSKWIQSEKWSRFRPTHAWNSHKTLYYMIMPLGLTLTIPITSSCCNPGTHLNQLLQNKSKNLSRKNSGLSKSAPTSIELPKHTPTLRSLRRSLYETSVPVTASLSQLYHHLNPYKSLPRY